MDLEVSPELLKTWICRSESAQKALRRKHASDLQQMSTAHEKEQQGSLSNKLIAPAVSLHAMRKQKGQCGVSTHREDFQWICTTLMLTNWCCKDIMQNWFYVGLAMLRSHFIAAMLLS